MEYGGEECDYIIKIILIGDSSVGKTCLINKFNDPNSSSTLDVNTTIGYEFWSKFFEQDDRIVQVHLWDTAGQERHRSMVSTYYRKTAGAVLVYDITNYSSFENWKSWIDELKSHNEENWKLIIVGNKLDLEENREVSTGDGERLAQENDAAFFEASAVNGTNVRGLFETLVTKIIECLKKMETVDEKEKGGNLLKSSVTSSVRLESESENKKKKCKICVLL